MLVEIVEILAIFYLVWLRNFIDSVTVVMWNSQSSLFLLVILDFCFKSRPNFLAMKAIPFPLFFCWFLCQTGPSHLLSIFM